VTGANDRRNGSVILQDEQHADVLRWNFENAWPNKIEGPALNAAANEIALESVELIVEDIELEVS
jgi:phage tail-like protein